MINAIFNNYEADVLRRVGLSYSGLVMCELGNQWFFCGKGTVSQSAKVAYEGRGAQHTSIDINGRDGALPLDLDLPVPKDLENKFELITNYGTTEHVNNQYSVFKNIHVMGKPGCVMIHGVPFVGNWHKHGRYYYSRPFFKGLANLCGYTLIDLGVVKVARYKFPHNLLACVLRKEKATPFISAKKFSSIDGLVDSGNLVNTGNYTESLGK